MYSCAKDSSRVQLSLLVIDLTRDKGGVSTLVPFKDPRIDQGTGTTLEGVEEDEVQQSAVLKDIPEAYALRHEEADRASEFSVREHQRVTACPEGREDRNCHQSLW